MHIHEYTLTHLHTYIHTHQIHTHTQTVGHGTKFKILKKEFGGTREPGKCGWEIREGTGRLTRMYYIHI